MGSVGLYEMLNAARDKKAEVEIQLSRRITCATAAAATVAVIFTALC